jgi:nucleoside 2-deoxyribosyltransferase
VPAVYVASALGFSEATRPFNETLLGALRGAGFETIDPWADPDGATTAAFDAAQSVSEIAAINTRLAAANFASIRRADAVIALLDGPDVDSGVAAEIGYAFAVGTPVIGLRLDFRRSGDNDAAPVNLQVHHCLAAPLARSVADALAGLARALG